MICSEGDMDFLGSSSVSDSDTGAGAMDGRCDGGFLEISGVDCAYGVRAGMCTDGVSGGMAVIAPPGIFQSRKSGEMGRSLGLKSKGSCSASIGLVVGVPEL